MTTGLLDGRPILASSPARWRLKGGVMPAIETFDMTPEDAKKLSFGVTKPIELVIEANGINVIVQNLYVISLAPGDNPHIVRVSVADRRWLWSYTHILRRFNIRRNVGFQRAESPFGGQVADVTRRVWYANWSLKNPNGDPPEAKWDARSALEDVFKGDGTGRVRGVFDAEIEWSGSIPRLAIRPEVGNKIQQLPIENLELDDAGDQAVQRLLSYLPEASVFIDYDGDVVVYSRASGADSEIVQTMGAEMVGRGHMELVKNFIVRPRKIRLLFTREVELRFDFIEGGSVTEDSRSVDNVLASPDFQINATIGGQSVQVVQGTWITFTEALGAWGTVGGNPIAAFLGEGLLKKILIPFVDPWGVAQLAGRLDPDADWVARIAAAQKHYRQTYRLPPRWMNRILSLRPYLVGTIDPVSGQRAPASVYSDYCIIYTARAILKERKAGGNGEMAMNVSAFPGGRITDQRAVKVAPATLSILDPDQGVVHLDFSIDPWRLYEMILPSQMESDTIPIADMQTRAQPIGFNVVGRSQKTAKLASNHKVAIILTAIPASPNNSMQLHAVEVEPGQIKKLLPPAAQATVEQAFGPTMEVRIGPAQEVARVRWNDDYADVIEALFGLRNPEDVKDFSDRLSAITINDQPQAEVGAEAMSLQSFAFAYAARIYASLVDRFEGSKTVHALTSLTPAGWIEEVDLQITTKGEATSSVSMPEKLPQLSMASFLDSSTRALFYKIPRPLK